MTLSDAINYRNEWQSTKSDYNDKIDRLNTAISDYEKILTETDWHEFTTAFYEFMNNVDPALSKTNWEGSRVRTYKGLLSSISSYLSTEEYNHYDVVTQFATQVNQYKKSAEDAQSHVDQWQRVIDNWDEKDD